MGNHKPDDFDALPETDSNSPLLDLPVPLNGRNYCGELDIRIDRAGKWFYNGTPITRKVMVSLFASLLRRADDGGYWLVSPTEMGRIDVEDAPFVITQMTTKNEGEEQAICLFTNIDISLTVCEDSPILMKPSPVTGEMTPYVVMPGNIDARIERSIYYDLVELGTVMDLGDEKIFGVWSCCSFFPLGSMQDTDV